MRRAISHICGCTGALNGTIQHKHEYSWEV
jgi:hypothetical protein